MASEPKNPGTLKHIATIEFGNLSSRILTDVQGRRCISLPIGGRDVCFTITQALMVREMLDAGLRALAHVKQVHDTGDKEDA